MIIMAGCLCTVIMPLMRFVIVIGMILLLRVAGTSARLLSLTLFVASGICTVLMTIMRICLYSRHCIDLPFFKNQRLIQSFEPRQRKCFSFGRRSGFFPAVGAVTGRLLCKTSSGQ